MKAIYFLFCSVFMIISVSIQAQNICGILCDSVTNEPLSQANISAFVGNNAIFKGCSNNEGRFFIESKEMPTSVEFSYVGYNTKSVLIDGNNSDLGVIKLSPIVLSEVKIVASTINHGINKDVFIVTD